MKSTTRFKNLIHAPVITCMPGVHDPLTARVAEQVGFDVLTCGGYSATASLLGKADTSVLTMTELAGHYARICDAVSVPVFGDGDTGFGNVTNTSRTVRCYERTGLAGMFIEDQVYPKRCGHMSGKAVISPEDMVAKLKSALDSRYDPDFIIMARTDAVAVHGIDEAIERGQLYRETGADMIFVEAPNNQQEMRRICSEIDAPCMANNIEGGKSPLLPGPVLADLGYAVYTHPVAMSHAIAHIAFLLYQTLKRDATTEAMAESIMDFEAFHQLVGLTEQKAREQACLDFATTLLANHTSGSDDSPGL